MSFLFQAIFLIGAAVTEVNGLNVLAHWSLNGSETGLTLHGGPTFVEGRLPGTKAIAFTKINSYARIPRVSLQHRSFTIAVWIKVYSILSRPQHFVSDWYSPYNFYFGILQNNGNLIFSRHTQNGDWPSVKTSFSITPKNWQHVAVTWNSTNLEYKLYLNGTEVYSKILSSDKTRWRSERSTFELGDSKHSVESQFLGELMDLHIIDGTVKTEQINFIKDKEENEGMAGSRALVSVFQDQGQCIQGTSWRIEYSDAIEDHAIVGPLLKSITALTDNDCKDACFMHVPDVCYMFNYHPKTKKCELFYKDRASEYRVEMRSGYLFKTLKCKSNQCLNGGQCYSLGQSTQCLCRHGRSGPTCA